MMFVCANGELFMFADTASALAEARRLAASHRRVAIDDEETQARCIWCRALPGMVVCRRERAPDGVACYPLTSTTALVTS